MKYYISYTGKPYTSTMTRNGNEAVAKLQWLSSSLTGLDILEIDDNVEPMRKNCNIIQRRKRKISRKTNA